LEVGRKLIKELKELIDIQNRNSEPYWFSAIYAKISDIEKWIEEHELAFDHSVITGNKERWLKFHDIAMEILCPICEKPNDHIHGQWGRIIDRKTREIINNMGIITYGRRDKKGNLIKNTEPDIRRYFDDNGNIITEQLKEVTESG